MMIGAVRIRALVDVQQNDGRCALENTLSCSTMLVDAQWKSNKRRTTLEHS